MKSHPSSRYLVLAAACVGLLVVGALMSPPPIHGDVNGLLNIGLSALPLALLLVTIGPQGIAQTCRTPRQCPWSRRAVVAGALSMVGMVLLGAVIGGVYISGNDISGLLAGPGILISFSPLVFIQHHLGAAWLAPGLVLWFSLGFVSGAFFKRGWAIVSAWLLLVCCHAGFSIWGIFVVLSH